MAEPTDIRLSPGDIAVCEDGVSYVWTSGYTGAENLSGLAPIRRAVVVTRLRALADEIEASD